MTLLSSISLVDDETAFQLPDEYAEELEVDEDEDDDEDDDELEG